MSHTYDAYPQPSHNEAAWLIREDEADYNARPPATPLELTDKIIDRLEKAKALAWLLNSAEEYPDGTRQNATWLLADLIHESLELNRRLWEICKDYEPRKR